MGRPDSYNRPQKGNSSSLEEEIMERTIGEAAGKVWQALSKGPLAVTEISKNTKLPADLANQAIGWLAREGKVVSASSPKGTVLKLK